VPVGRIVFGRWGNAPGEEIVACRIGGGIELHCHGGRVASQRILADLASAGCRIEACDAAVGQDGELLKREALISLMQARTERTAAILLDQYHGALDRACDELLQLTVEQRLIDVVELLDRMLGWSGVGLHLAIPWKVVLAGRPNVGKSSLINALLGYQRAIVFDQPGTTRDAVATETTFDGWPVALSDTAGLRNAADELEQLGISRSLSEAADADCVVLVFDASQSWSDEDQRLLTAHPNAIVVHNKDDLETGGERPLGLRTSATRRSGIEQLIAAIASELVPIAPPPRAAIPTTPRQVAWLRAAHHAAQGNDTARLTTCLEQLRSSERRPA
jgi:tRNA modification GTPase